MQAVGRPTQLIVKVFMEKLQNHIFLVLFQTTQTSWPKNDDAMGEREPNIKGNWNSTQIVQPNTPIMPNLWSENLRKPSHIHLWICLHSKSPSAPCLVDKHRANWWNWLWKQSPPSTPTPLPHPPSPWYWHDSVDHGRQNRTNFVKLYWKPLDSQAKSSKSPNSIYNSTLAIIDIWPKKNPTKMNILLNHIKLCWNYCYISCIFNMKLDQTVIDL